MKQPTIAPYGSWKSPLTSDLLVQGSLGVGQPQLDGEDIYWVEMRPNEGGRNVIVRRAPDGAVADVTPQGFNARNKVHEYGGGDYVVAGGVIYFTNFSDQGLYRLEPGGEPDFLTGAGKRHADLLFDKWRNAVIAVCEDHTNGSEPLNSLVAVKTDGSYSQTLAQGRDFYSSPALSPDGKYLAWLEWNHPNMPWDGTELWLAEFTEDGSLTEKRKVAGGSDESVFQPQWSLRGYLHFVSDRSGWWNLYALRDDGEIERDCTIEAECGQPQWVFALSTYAFVAPSRLVCAYSQDGLMRLAMVDTISDAWADIPTPYTDMQYVRADAQRIVMRAASPTEPASIVLLDLAAKEFVTLRRSSDLQLDAGYVAIAQAVEFPTENGLTAHGFYYAPTNPDYAAPAGEKPPLLVMSHGGPTAQALGYFYPKIQYWTSRGIAVLDVNYGGSTGYGRAYRQRLNGQWGVVDVDDCCNGAKYLVEKGLADGQKLMITGGSAGGYTTLCALAFRDVFRAGASHYGVSDAEALELDTHKFESRYSHSLIGPYPAEVELYRQRSPIHYAHQLSCPVIFFQGLEDKVVPPAQSETMFEAVKRKGIPTAYVTFEGEQHGFRQAPNIRRALDGELYFYSRIFGFELAEMVEPVAIVNL